MDELVENQKEGRREEQKTVLDYFQYTRGGCLGKKTISDEEFDRIAREKISSVKDRMHKRVLSDINEKDLIIEPITLSGFDLEAKSSLSRRGLDGKTRTSAYRITKFYFTDKQIYLYKFCFNFTNDRESETIEEYFYKDIGMVSSRMETEETPVQYAEGGWLSNKTRTVYETSQKSVFSFAVAGMVKEFSFNSAPGIDASIQEMKAKLREKKGV